MAMNISSKSRKKAVFSEINITPLTDIFLVLLIIMMVVAPMFQSNIEGITIPEINSGLTVEEKAVTVSITKEGNYYLNGEPTSLEELSQQLVKLKSTLKKPEVLVKADTDAKSKEILQVMRAAKNAEYEKLTVAGEPLSRKEQNKLNNTARKHTAVYNKNSSKNIQKTDKFVQKPDVEKNQTDFSNTDWEE